MDGHVSGSRHGPRTMKYSQVDPRGMMSDVPADRARTVALGDRKVHRIGLGTNRLTDSEPARAFLREAVELGLSFIDTADVYRSNESESTIGQALGPAAPGLVIATKGGLIRTAEGLTVDGRPEHLREAVEGSLRRLRTERIELYHLHRPDSKVPIESSVGALKEMQAEGKIRQIGISNVTVEDIERARRVAKIVSVQNRYSLWEREQEAVVDYCGSHSIVFIPWYPLQHGELGAASTLNVLATRRGLTPHQLALRWLLKRSPMMLPIPGTLTIAHLRENLAAADDEMSDDDFQELSRASGAAVTAERT